MKQLLVGVILLCFSYLSFGQLGEQKWTQKPFSNIGFIENIGQIGELQQEKVHYYASYDNFIIYFSSHSIRIGHFEIPSAEETHERFELLEHGEDVPPLNWYHFKIDFLNANLDAIIEPSDVNHHTVNSQDQKQALNTLKAKTFKHLTYKNIYPNIDLLLELPEEGGLKYSFLVHPDGNHSLIQMRYSNAELDLDPNGEVKITSAHMPEFSDMQPVSWSGEQQLESAFELNGNTVSFSVADYDTDQPLIIDPWLVAVIPFASESKGYEIGYDIDGNCSVLGNWGEQIAFYDSFGVLQWIWTDPAVDPTTPPSFIGILGDMVSNPENGDIYYLRPFTSLSRINNLGDLINEHTFDVFVEINEQWRLHFDPVHNEIWVGGGSTIESPDLERLNADLTLPTIYNTLTSDDFFLLDNVLLDMDTDGSSIYFLPNTVNIDIGTEFTNKLYRVERIDPLTIVWETPTFHHFTEVNNVPYYAVGLDTPLLFNSNGFNGITVGDGVVYTYDGDRLQKYNAETGEIIDSVFLGMIEKSHAGIDLDFCGNIYIGTDDSVLVFDSNMERQPGIAVNDTVYDLIVYNERLYVTGKNFVTQIDIPHLGFDLSINSTFVPCEACSGTASISYDDCGSYALESINWSPGGETTESINSLCEGWYVATVVWENEFGIDTTVIDSIFIMDTGESITADELISNESCSGLCNGSITVTPTSGMAPFTYMLGAETNTTGTFDELCGGTYTLTVTDDNGCTYTNTVIIETESGLGLSVLSYNEPSCYGFTDGSLTVETIAGVGEVTYTWIPANPVIGATHNNLGEGTYVVNAVSAMGCSDSIVIELGQPDSIYADITVFDALCNTDSSGVVLVDSVYNAQGDLNNIAYFWTPSYFGGGGIGADSGYYMPVGDYTLTINDDNGCSNVIDFSISEPPPLFFSEIGFEPAYCRLYGYQSGNGVVYAAATGGIPDYTYNWVNAETLEENIGSTWGSLNPGNYVITATDENGCELIQTIQLDSLNPEAIITVTSEQLDDNCEGTELVVANFGNASQNFVNPNNPGSDTTFKWNLDYPNANWQITHDYFETFDSSYVGEAIYQVCLVAMNKNGCTDTTCKDLIVHVQPEFLAPNVFSPGVNGVNDIFTFDFITIGIETFSCTIVNRWGVKVAVINNISDGWDGTDFNGDACTNGVYFYSYEAISTNNTVFTGQGSVQLVRQ